MLVVEPTRMSPATSVKTTLFTHDFIGSLIGRVIIRDSKKHLCRDAKEYSTMV